MLNIEMWDITMSDSKAGSFSFVTDLALPLLGYR